MNSNNNIPTGKGLLASYISGIMDREHGERYRSIFRYLIPEFVIALLIYSMPYWVDSYFVSHLSAAAYPTLGGINNIIHFFIKLAEGFSVGTVIMSGQLCGKQAYDRVGQAFSSFFWSTMLFSSILALLLYAGAPYILQWYGFPQDMIELGMPFLRLRTISIVMIFLFLVCIGFLRGVKNTRVPMLIYLAGAIIFIAFDYILIFGKLGLPALGLKGSAYASVIQYGSMLAICISYILFRSKHERYSLGIFTSSMCFADICNAMKLGWPLMVDKAVMAIAYVWLGKMICPLGKIWISTFCVVKDMERFAFLPAIAAAQVITFLVSNDYGAQHWQDIKSNIKKVGFVASSLVFIALVLISLYPEHIISLFDKTGEFTAQAAQVFPLLSVLVFFDLLQLILSGALRGTGDVKTVMFVRLIVCFGYFIPVSYLLSQSVSTDPMTKFLLIYGSFYVGNALMSVVYINKFRGEKWKQVSRIS